MLISRWNQPLLRWNFVAARALVALRTRNRRGRLFACGFWLECCQCIVVSV